MAEFEISYQYTRPFEGGYADRLVDRGGETYRGISRKIHPDWDGWMIVDMYKKRPGFPGTLDKDAILQAKVKSFYRMNYWKYDAIHSQSVANELYDTGVNCGVETAGEFLQRSLILLGRSVKVDGDVGPKTIAAVNSYSRPGLLLKCLNIWQGSHYFDICEANSEQCANLRGWLSRVNF